MGHSLYAIAIQGEAKSSTPRVRVTQLAVISIQVGAKFCWVGSVVDMVNLY